MSRPTVVVEAGFAAATSLDYLHLNDAARGLLDTGRLAPVEMFTDISSDVMGITITRGRNRILDAFGVGQAEIMLDNTSGDYDPSNTAGTYSPYVRPMVRIRIRAIWAETLTDEDGNPLLTEAGDPLQGEDTSYTIFYGFADSWDVQWPTYGTAQTVTLRASDAFKALASFEAPSAAASAGGGEDSGARIARLLDAAGWPETDRMLDTGDSTLQATTLDGALLSEMQHVALSELGSFYTDADGLVTFKRRKARLEGSRSVTVQATFDDDGTDLGYADIEVANDDELVKNIVSGTIIGGSVQTQTDASSRSSYLDRSYVQTGLWLQTDEDASRWAEWVLTNYKAFETRVESLTLRPQGQDLMWPTVLNSEFGDLMLVNRRPTTGDAHAQYVFLEGIDHTITADDWETVFRFSSATAYMGHIVLDSTDENRWLDYGTLAGF